MRIISTEPPPGFVKEIVCTQCGTTLEYIPKDIKLGGGRGIPTYPIVECLNCRAALSIG